MWINPLPWILFTFPHISILLWCFISYCKAINNMLYITWQKRWETHLFVPSSLTVSLYFFLLADVIETRTNVLLHPITSCSPFKVGVTYLPTLHSFAAKGVSVCNCIQHETLNYLTYELMRVILMQFSLALLKHDSLKPSGMEFS